MEMALRQILDNAVKYSTPGSTLAIRGEEREGRVLIGIRNEGSEIPESEQSRIFDKFYRVPGTHRTVRERAWGCRSRATSCAPTRARYG